ncbi:MAG: AI-2E family transporter [Candidatus Liptonbacteria bacterium]|nr:AI-2E family transporter [Candidatus Liptonbacteria bacterium]
MDGRNFEISWISLWRLLFFGVFVFVLFQGSQILLGLFLAIIISSGLDVIVDFLERHGIPRTLGVILIFLFGLILLIILVYAVLPLAIVELNTIFSGLNQSSTNSLLKSLVNIKTSQSAGALLSKLSSDFFSGGVSPLDFFSKTLGSFGLAIAVLVSSFYLSLSRDGVERFIKTVFPPDYEKMALRIYERSRKKIGFWFQTQVFLSFVMGILVWVSLLILGVKHAFIVGILAGIFELMPFVGPILSGAVAVIMALSTSASLALYTLLVFLALHQFESHVLVPILTRRTVGLHPVIVIVALLIGAEVGGFLGVLIAVPAAAVFQEIIDEWSTRKRAAPEPAL